MWGGGREGWGGGVVVDIRFRAGSGRAARKRIEIPRNRSGLDGWVYVRN